MQRDIIATYELIGRRGSEPSFLLRVLLSKPIQSERMAPAWCCEVTVDPLWSKPFEIYGEGSFQALCLAAKHAVQILATYTEQGGSLEYLEGDSFDPQVFGFELLPRVEKSGDALFIPADCLRQPLNLNVGRHKPVIAPVPEVGGVRCTPNLERVMTDLVAELSQRARELAPEDRARLAEELLASLEGDQAPEVDAAWDEEIRKRIGEVESGAVQLRPADEVFAQVRRNLR